MKTLFNLITLIALISLNLALIKITHELYTCTENGLIQTMGDNPHLPCKPRKFNKKP